MILVDYMTWKKSNIIKRNSHPNLVEHLPFSGTLGMKSVPSRQELPFSKGGGEWENPRTAEDVPARFDSRMIMPEQV